MTVERFVWGVVTVAAWVVAVLTAAGLIDLAWDLLRSA